MPAIQFHSCHPLTDRPPCCGQIQPQRGVQAHPGIQCHFVDINASVPYTRNMSDEEPRDPTNNWRCEHPLPVCRRDGGKHSSDDRAHERADEQTPLSHRLRCDLERNGISLIRWLQATTSTAFNLSRHMTPTLLTSPYE